MKKVNIIIIFLIVINLWSNAQTKFTNDTLMNLTLKNDVNLKSNYRVLFIYLNDSSRKYLQLKKDSRSITSIPLPIEDEEVKNFSVDRIILIKNGFRLIISWGDWYNFNYREFDFVFRNNQYQLIAIKLKTHTFEPEKEIIKKKSLSHPILIQRFNLIKYIEENRLY